MGGIDDPVWDHSTFSKNRERLLAGEVARKFLSAVLVQPRAKRLLSSEHLSVDGALIEAWASMKSLQPKDGSGGPPARGRNGERDFHGATRTNDTMPPDFVMELREINVPRHVAQSVSRRRSAIDRRTTRHPGYAASQRIRKRIEEASAGQRPSPDSTKSAIAPRQGRLAVHAGDGRP